MDGVEAARQLVDTAWCAGLTAPPIRGPAEWADDVREMGTNESPFPGKWSTDRTPYMREPMAKMALSHPASEVVLQMAAQIAKTQATINLLGQIITESPCAVLVVVPTARETINYHKDKLGPMIENTPKVAARVDPSRSSSTHKHFPGGHIEIVGANSSAGLQSRSVRVLIADELSEWPYDVDGRGDPMHMAEARTTAYGRRAKVVKVSTPAIKGACRITDAYEAGSRATYQVACPHCGERQELLFKRLHYDPADLSTAAYACRHCGAMIAESHKAAMVADGVWVHERPELADVRPSYRLSALYSPFRGWGWVAERRERSRDDPKLDKVFSQQVLGEAWEQNFNTVPHQALWERRIEYPSGRIPPACLFLEGATDVQGDRLEWAVYGFDRDFGQWWIDGGVLVGDPSEMEVWAEHDRLLARRWRDAWGRDWPVESWGVDSGYLSHHVYRYARRHAARGTPRVMALDGRAKWGEPAIGTPKIRDLDWNGKKIGVVQLWPVGTWDLKGEVTSAMMLTQHGPDGAGVWPKGAMRFPTRLDLGYFEQLTAEALITRSTKKGYDIREWIKTRARNEAFDLAVYTRALARHDTAGLTDEGWARLVSRRQNGDAGQDLIALMQGGIAADVAMPEPVDAPAIETVIPRPQARTVTGVGRRVV